MTRYIVKIILLGTLLLFYGCNVGVNNPNAVFNLLPGQGTYSLADSTLPTVSYTISLVNTSTSQTYTLKKVSYATTLTSGETLSQFSGENSSNSFTLSSSTTTQSFSPIQVDWSALKVYMTANNITQVYVTYTFEFQDNYMTTTTVNSTISVTLGAIPASSFYITNATMNASGNALTLTFSLPPSLGAGTATSWNDIASNFSITGGNLTIANNDVVQSSMSLIISGVSGYQANTFSINASSTQNASLYYIDGNGNHQALVQNSNISF